MEIKKWDGITDADEILNALLHFVSGEDQKRCIETSYGDFGKYIQNRYKDRGAGNGGTYTIQGSAKCVYVTLGSKRIRYSLTWNKAAKLMHRFLKECI